MNGLKGEKGDPADISGMLGLRVSAPGLAQGLWGGDRGPKRGCLGGCIPPAVGSHMAEPAGCRGAQPQPCVGTCLTACFALVTP